jgi:hypothetical protein
MNAVSKLVLFATVPLAVAVTDVRAARAQVVDYPSEAYVAGYTPIYYNGFAHYYWHNHFYYRDHGGWHGYAHEPAALWGRRGEWGTHRHRW